MKNIGGFNQFSAAANLKLSKKIWRRKRKCPFSPLRN